MKKVLIIGCGYGGVVAAWRLSAHRDKFEVTVIDKGRNFNFLPLLPDCLGRKINPAHLAYPIEKLSVSYNFNFVNEEVKAVDIEKQFVTTTLRNFNYDYLIISSGSETNFYGNEEIRKYAYKCDDAFDAARITRDVERKGFGAFIIAGGGYTGIEVATNLRVGLSRVFRKDKIIVVERAPAILGPMPAWMKDHVSENLKRLDIEVLTEAVVEKIEGRRIALSGGRSFSNAMLIWAAGVRTADFIQNLKCEKNPQGRIKVDDHLRLKENCFVIGDASYFQDQSVYLRMAVQFAIAQGNRAASNILRLAKGSSLKKFRPSDLGFLIPMANNQACGTVFGMKVKGKIAIAMHYIMSLYRAYGIKNKWGILGALIRRN